MEPARAADAPFRRILPWALGAAVLGALYLLEVPTCPARRILGVPCPGCGLTRATVALVRLDVAAAFALHPAVFALIPVVGWLALHGILGADRFRSPPAWVWIAGGVLLIGLWAARLAGAFGGHPDL